jgi:hypothetical protein
MAFGLAALAYSVRNGNAVPEAVEVLAVDGLTDLIVLYEVK